MSAKMVTAIDPGTTHSGYVLYLYDTAAPKSGKIFNKGFLPNAEILEMLCSASEVYVPMEIAIEMIGHYGTGMPAGKTTFQTCVWIGRFQQAAQGIPFHFVLRPTVKAEICGSAKAKDANVAQALLDLFGPKGTKRAPGPTFGMSGHLWSALAVAVTHAAGKSFTDFAE